MHCYCYASKCQDLVGDSPQHSIEFKCNIEHLDPTKAIQVNQVQGCLNQWPNIGIVFSSINK